MELVLKRIGKVLTKALFKLTVLMIFWQMYLHLNLSACTSAHILLRKQLLPGDGMGRFGAQKGFTPSH